MLKLGTIVKDNVVGIKGMLTIFSVDMANNQHYLFQPSALNPKTQQPVDSYWITAPRVDGWETENRSLPIDILGSEVTDIATGFKGIAISMEYHMNGCIHFNVKPKGIIDGTGESIGAREFDIRRLKGKMIKKLDTKSLENSKVENPSPEYSPSLSRV